MPVTISELLDVFVCICLRGAAFSKRSWTLPWAVILFVKMRICIYMYIYDLSRQSYNVASGNNKKSSLITSCCTVQNLLAVVSIVNVHTHSRVSPGCPNVARSCGLKLRNPCHADVLQPEQSRFRRRWSSCVCSHCPFSRRCRPRRLMLRAQLHEIKGRLSPSQLFLPSG